MKTIRNSFYTKYEDKEYRISNHTPVSVDLISDDMTDLQNGFLKFHHDYALYKKQVNIKEVGLVYRIRTFGVYKGIKVLVNTYETENQYLIFNDSSQEAIDLGFTVIDRDQSEKWVNKDEVTLFEEKTLIPNFFGIS